MSNQTPLRSSVLYLADHEKQPTHANDDNDDDAADQHEALVNRFETPVVATPRRRDPHSSPLGDGIQSSGQASTSRKRFGASSLQQRRVII